MRLQFQEGKQRELLKKEKEKLSLTWLKFAESLGMKYGKLWSFVSEERLIDEETFKKMRSGDNYKKFIIRKLNPYWGQSKGGKISEGSTKRIKIPDKNEELAELWGIMLGDGCLQKIKGYKLGVYGIDIAGHSENDRDYLINFVKPLISRLFDINTWIYESKCNRCIHVKAVSRKLVDFFERGGFKAGNKILNQVTIPDWIKENDRFLAACLRGLFDTDGSFYRLTTQNSYQINLCNKNQRLLKDAREGVINNGAGNLHFLKCR
jgi:intein/homing endonuclease